MVRRHTAGHLDQAKLKRPQLVKYAYHSRCQNRLVTGRVVGNPYLGITSRLPLIRP